MLILMLMLLVPMKTVGLVSESNVSEHTGIEFEVSAPLTPTTLHAQGDIEKRGMSIQTYVLCGLTT